MKSNNIDRRNRRKQLEEDDLGLKGDALYDLKAGVQFWQRLKDTRSAIIPYKEDVRPQMRHLYESSALSIELLSKVAYEATAVLIADGRKGLEWLRPLNLGDLTSSNEERIIDAEALRPGPHDGIVRLQERPGDPDLLPDENGHWRYRYYGRPPQTMAQRHTEEIQRIFGFEERKLLFSVRGFLVAALDAKTTTRSLRCMTKEEKEVWRKLRNRRSKAPRELGGAVDSWGRPANYWRTDLDLWQDYEPR